MRSLLLDTGPLVAFIDESDNAHSVAADRLDGFTGRIHTTSAVITESMYFLSRFQQGPTALAELVLSTGITIHDYSQPRQLLSAASLMSKYADTPMDYADATLLLLAEDVGIRHILTFDLRGFSTFRTSGKRPLTIFGRF